MFKHFTQLLILSSFFLAPLFFNNINAKSIYYQNCDSIQVSILTNGIVINGLIGKINVIEYSKKGKNRKKRIFCRKDCENFNLQLDEGEYNIRIRQFLGKEICDQQFDIIIGTICDVNGGEISIGDEKRHSINVCADSLTILEDVNIIENQGENQGWFITDRKDKILLLSEDNQIPLIGTGTGVGQTLNLYHFSYQDSIKGLGIGSNVHKEIEGCFDISNPIRINQKKCVNEDSKNDGIEYINNEIICAVNGGKISIGNEKRHSINICVDSLATLENINIAENKGENQGWFVTDRKNKILLLSNDSLISIVDIDTAANKKINLYHFSYQDSISGLEIGSSIHREIEGCFDISNPIRINLKKCFVENDEDDKITCDSLIVSTQSNKIIIEGLTGKTNIIKIRGKKSKYRKNKTCKKNCNKIEIPVPSGNYNIFVTQKKEEEENCKSDYAVTVEETESSNRNAPILDFVAYHATRNVNLQWATNTGYKNSYFEVEKSTDGHNFEILEYLNNDNFTEELISLQVTDVKPKLGENYYRIKQIYTDDTYDYSQVRKVNFNISLDQLSIYPNPAANEVFINLKPYVGKSGQLNLYNQYGQLVKTTQLDNIDAAPTRIDLGDIINGLYHISIKINESGVLMSKNLSISRDY